MTNIDLTKMVTAEQKAQALIVDGKARVLAEARNLRTKLFGVLEMKRASSKLIITTDDGSAGERGRVTDVLPGIIDKSEAAVVYAAGPMGMLSAVATIAAEHRAYSQCSVEEAMACGIGICMTCVLPVIGADGVTRMVRSCVEGPVFRGDRVRWDDVGTIPTDAFGAPVVEAS